MAYFTNTTADNSVVQTMLLAYYDYKWLFYTSYMIPRSSLLFALYYSITYGITMVLGTLDRYNMLVATLIQGSQPGEILTAGFRSLLGSIIIIIIIIIIMTP